MLETSKLSTPKKKKKKKKEKINKNLPPLLKFTCRQENEGPATPDNRYPPRYKYSDTMSG